MSYEREERSESYNEDDDCLSLTADNDLAPLTPPEQLQIQQQLQSPQVHHILHPQQYQTQGLLQQHPMQARHGHHHPMQGSTRQPSPAPTLVITTIGLLFGIFLSPIFLIAPFGYLLGVVISGFLVGKSFATKFMLPIALITMHMSWGWGFLTSSKRGLRRG